MRFSICFFLLSGLLFGSELLVNTPDGETYVWDVDPDERVGELQDRLSSVTDDAGYIVAVPSSTKPLDASKKGAYLGHPRDYAREVSTGEQNHIRFIVTTLANKSLVSIGFMKGDLERAGDQIDHLHPLRFLMTLFTDEEMKVGIRNVRKRGWIWSEFSGGLKQSLTTEANIGNIQDEHIYHFAQTVEIDVEKIYPAIQQRKWDQLIDMLITDIPRKGDHNRYGD